MDYPKDFLSGVSDGMAQSHTVLPWMANQSMFPEIIPQHLQGQHYLLLKINKLKIQFS